MAKRKKPKRPATIPVVRDFGIGAIGGLVIFEVSNHMFFLDVADAKWCKQVLKESIKVAEAAA